jgi:ABC-type nitrate/sulfonate/bicarbonate transport system ATPase subunit
MTYKNAGVILSVENVTLSFDNKTILKDVNFSLYDWERDQTTGQVVTLLGKSGIGKTQLMKMLAGLQAPTSGVIKLGADQHIPRRGEVGMVLQTYPLFEHRTVMSNLLMLGDRSKEFEQKAVDLSAELGVYEHIKKYPTQLSGGQRQRVAIIQQILCSDKFILLDEPFSGLDPVATEKLSLNIRKLADMHSENTIIISSHILEPSLAVSDTVIMLAKVPEQEYASVSKIYNLVEMDFAWHENIMANGEFMRLCSDVIQSFKL